MYIVTDDLLLSSIEQDFITINEMDLGAFRLYLYKELNPSGSLKVSIKQGSNVLFTETKTIADIISQSDLMTAINYFHGFITWDISSTIRLERETTYILVLEGVSGYTSGISWVKEFENLTNNLALDIDNFVDNPHSIQLWSKKDKGMIRVLDFDDGFTSVSAPGLGPVVTGSLEIDFDGYIYHRQNSGTDTSSDWRIRTDTGERVTEEYNGTIWVEKSATES